MTNAEKLINAMGYLRSRKIWLLDGDFCPTSSANTDVAATRQRYLQEIEKEEQNDLHV